jgi:hypothetical protein
MKRREIPPASKLRALFEYKDGMLFWRSDSVRGKIKAGDRAGYVDTDGYRVVGISGVYYKEHRVIWRMQHSRSVMPAILDHIDGDRSNNKVENLRVATEAENMRNKRPSRKRNPQRKNKLTIALGDQYG